LYKIENANTIIRSFKSLAVPVASVLLAAAVGAVILLISGTDPAAAYTALLKGAFGDLSSFSRTLKKATPLILNGLAVALALKAGLFNIGTQGQLLFGALASAVVGVSFQNLPSLIHVPFAMIAGIAAGGLYGFIQGALKAYTGAHEVITGIMFNYIAINITDYLANGPFRDTSSGNIIARTPLISETSFLSDVMGIPAGFLICLIAAAIVWWIFKSTVIGFEIKTVGSGINTARYSGIRIKVILMVTMLISGALAGLGGAIETQGIVHRFQPGFNIGLGFEGITIALLGRLHPFGIILAAILFGAMKSGAGLMQFTVDVETEIIDVIQALILFFVAAELLVERILPGVTGKRERLTLSSGWGGQA